MRSAVFTPQIMAEVCGILNKLVDSDTQIPQATTNCKWSIIQDLILIVTSLRSRRYPKLGRTRGGAQQRKKVLRRTGLSMEHIQIIKKMVENGEDLWALRYDYKKKVAYQLRGQNNDIGEMQKYEKKLQL